MLGLRSRPIVAGTAALVGFAALCIPFAHRPVVGIGAFVPIVVVITAVAQAATCAVLIAIYRRAPRRSTAVLAASFLAGALVIFAGAMTVPMGPPPLGALIPAGRQVAVWLYVLWHIGFALCAVAYAARRRSFEAELPAAAAPAYLWGEIAILGGAALAAVFALIVLDDRLPVMVGLHASVFRSSGVGPATFAVQLVATLIVLRRLRRGDEIDAALVLALVAATLDIGLHLVDDRRYVFAWYGARASLLAGSTFVLIASVNSLLHWRARALQLEGLLVGESQRADRHARRLSVLWKVASNPIADDDRFFHGLLMEASHALSDRGDFMGTIAHVEDDEAVMDVVHVADADAELEEKFHPGMRAPVDTLMMGEVLRRGETRSWPDVHRDARVGGLPGVVKSVYRSYVGTPFRAGATQYVLGFASRRPLPEPLSWEDHAYVETVASFCAMRLQQRSQFDRLRHQSTHDALTGLPNRTMFRNLAGDILGTGEPFALAIVDVDRFRETNDALGYQQGDAVLAEIARVLRGAVGTRDVVARVGGDSFGVLLCAVAGRHDVERRVGRLQSCFSDVLRAPLSASIGVALAPQDGGSVDRLLARADSALRAAKNAGGDRSSFFDARVEDAFARVRRLHGDLTRALEQRQFELYFQPHIELRTGRVVGAEALIRWNHPERGLLAPAEFVPFAEEQGMLVAIGAWVLRETVRISQPWRAADAAFRVWFNLSAVELNDASLLERVRELHGELRGMGAEITETAAMRNVHASMHTIAALRDAGLRIALDDFGTGYSSLAHLKRLPIDVVKIDQSFTAGLPSDAHDVAIVEAVIALAQHYGFETVAEGVESRHQADFLAAAGCRYAQGFVYAQPMPAPAFDAWLIAHVATA